jgi:hypothetical protein
MPQKAKVRNTVRTHLRIMAHCVPRGRPLNGINLNGNLNGLAHVLAGVILSAYRADAIATP